MPDQIMNMTNVCKLNSENESLAITFILNPRAKARNPAQYNSIYFPLENYAIYKYTHDSYTRT